MDLFELRTYREVVRTGRILIEMVFAHLEAFSENALYYRRGMPTMKKYKTVSEVCALTGLTRKHLYYFHHKNVVRAVDYANYSVEGHDGYKLYDDAAVEKLQQIALYYQLGLKRNEIRDIMLKPDYDSNMILKNLLTMEISKKTHIDRNVAALEYLCGIGVKSSFFNSLRMISLDNLGKLILELEKTTADENAAQTIKQSNMEKYIEEIIGALSVLKKQDEETIKKSVGQKAIKRIFDLSVQYIGANACPFVLGLLMSSPSEASLLSEAVNILAPYHIQAVIQYVVDHPEMYTHASGESVAESVGNKQEVTL